MPCTWASLLSGVMLLAACTTTAVPQLALPREQSRVYEYPFSQVWEATERVMREKRGRIALINQDAGLIRIVVPEGASVTAFVEIASPARTRVYVRRAAGSRALVNEAAILAEIATALMSRKE